MSNYQVQGPSRQCAETGRLLKPGDAFCTALIDDAGQFVRRDYAREAWKEPPAGTIAWWAGRIPEAGTAPKPTINDALLVDCLEHLTDTVEPDRLNFRYVVALLLMRRKRLRFDDLKKTGDREVMILRDMKTNRRHEVLDPKLSDEAMETVRQEVFKVLGWD